MKKLLATIMALVLALTLLPTSALATNGGDGDDTGTTPYRVIDDVTVYVAGGTEGTDYVWTIAGDYAPTTLTVKTSESLTISTADSDEEEGTPAANMRIVIPKSVSANITLSGANITSKTYYGGVNIQTGGELALTLKNTNSITGGNLSSAISVPYGARLVIKGEGSLTAQTAAQPSSQLAAIGENATCNGWGTIVIESGTITAKATQSPSTLIGAAIGGSSNNTSGTAGTIEIKGGTVTATTDNSGAAAIGAGAKDASLNKKYASGGDIMITGGTVNADSIGGGTNTDSGNILITSGATINPTTEGGTVRIGAITEGASSNIQPDGGQVTKKTVIKADDTTTPVAKINGAYYFGETAIKAVTLDAGDCVDVCHGNLALTNAPVGLTVCNSGAGTVSVNSKEVAANEKYTVPATVKFVTNCDTNVSDQTVQYNGVATAPTVTKTGHTLDGWYTDSSFAENSKWDFTKDVTANMTLYAKWTVNTYTVTYETNGGSKVAAAKVNYGCTIPTPTDDPTKSDYKFDGWYTNAGLTEQLVADAKMGDADITLYAKWTGVESGNSKTESKTETKDGTTTTTDTKTETTTKDNVKTETKTETVTTKDATTGAVTGTVETKTTTEIKGSTATTTETVTTKNAEGETTGTVVTDATVETKGATTTTEKTVTKTDTATGEKVVEETKTVADATATTEVKTTSADGKAAEAVVTVSSVTKPTTGTAVTLDATTAESTNTDKLTKVEVTISKADAEKLESAKTVEVKTDVGTLTINKNALKTITENEGENVTLTITEKTTGTTPVANAAKTFELTAKVGDNDKAFTDSKGTITVSVPMAAPGFRQQHVCYYYNEGKMTRMGGTFDGKNFSWDTNHFSTFVIATETVSTNRAYIDLNGGSSATTTTTTGKKASSATTFDAGVGIYAATAILSVTGMAWVGKKKH